MTAQYRYDCISLFQWPSSNFKLTPTGTIFAGIVLSWMLAIFNALLKRFTDWKDVSIFNTFAFFVVPLMLIVAAYIGIFFTAKKSIKEHMKRSLKKVNKCSVFVWVLDKRLHSPYM